MLSSWPSTARSWDASWVPSLTAKHGHRPDTAGAELQGFQEAPKSPALARHRWGREQDASGTRALPGHTFPPPARCQPRATERSTGATGRRTGPHGLASRSSPLGRLRNTHDTCHCSRCCWARVRPAFESHHFHSRTRFLICQGWNRIQSQAVFQVPGDGVRAARTRGLC